MNFRTSSPFFPSKSSRLRLKTGGVEEGSKDELLSQEDWELVEDRPSLMEWLPPIMEGYVVELTSVILCDDAIFSITDWKPGG